MNLRQKAVKGVVWSAIQSWGRQAISFIVFALLARLLAPEVFGLVALAGVFLAFTQVFLDQGFADAIVQREHLDPEHLDTAFWTNLGIGLLLTLLGIAVAGLVADLFNQPQLTPIIRWLSLSFLLRALSAVQEAIFRRNLAFKPLAVRTLIAGAVGGLVGVTMAFMGFGVWSLVGQQLVDSLVQVIVLWLASDWRPRINFSAKHFKDLFSFGINVVGINILNFLNTRSDDLLIGYFLGPVALGYYSIAYRLLQIVTQLLIGVINGLAMPVFSRLQGEPEQLRKAFYSAIQLSSLVAFPAFLGLSVLAPELLVVLFGKQWAPSIPVMQILSLVGLLYAGFYFNGPVIMAVGKPTWNLGLTLLQAVCNVVAFAIAVRWGIVAVAAAYAIRSYLMAPITIWVVHHLVRIEIATYLRQYAAPLVGGLIMVIAILGTKHFLIDIVNSHTLLGISVVLGFLLYPATISLIAPKLFGRLIELFRSAFPQTSWKKN
jgi:O-antigen/teichoic acid export membrane protein